MNSDFEKWLEELQRKIEYSEHQKYSKVVIREYKNPINFGNVKQPDTQAKIKGPCGDTMKISLKIHDSKIIDARFWTDGCGATIACGNMLMKLIKGTTLKEALKFTPEILIKALDGLPEENHHCSNLSINTLQQAIQNYKQTF